MFGRHKSMTDQARTKARKAADKADFNALDDLFDDIEEMAINRLQALRNRLKASAGHFRWNGFGSSARDEWEVASDRTSRYVHDHPWQAIGIAALVLLAVSSLKSRS
ncbi:MAG TPA: hypothetical protein VFK46_06890 [Candidatus Macondimonas sp.]|nr:hypothetical protein [Candidatus Macondimonas sp.]